MLESCLQDSDAEPEAHEGHESQEVAKLTIEITSPEGVGPSGHTHTGDRTTADDFFRSKGAAAPAVALLSLLNSAVASLHPVRPAFLFL